MLIYGIEKILPYLILTVTGSTSLLFHIICSKENSMQDNRFREIIFEVNVRNDIISRFDTSREYWEQFNVRDKSLEKKLGYFEIEIITNPSQIVIAINPKEHYEHFKDFSHKRKHKGKKRNNRNEF